jgi:methylenetetrahydrofolate dehydrogenase (NADP+)/methenyltetrahydrofolate cyclohydrolase
MAIAPSKDVDGFHPQNLGLVAKGLPGFIAATPLGVLRLIEFYNIETAGKHAVVIGRSQIVGLPMSILLQRSRRTGNATVTICHSHTQDLPSFTRQADILIAALGRPGFVTADMVKPGAVVIDVGLTRVEDATKKSGFRLAGDVDFEAVAPLASSITPVPGGVGPMTICGLLENTYKAYAGL